MYTGKDVTKLPYVNYICQCRIYATIINEIIAAMRLGLVSSRWPAMYHNGNSQRQCTLYNFLFRIIDKWFNKIDPPMIVSSCIVMIDRTAEGIKEAINSKV